MLYSTCFTTLLATIQTLVEHSPTVFSPQPPKLPTSENVKLRLKAINLGLHPIIETEFGARASVLLQSADHRHPHHLRPAGYQDHSSSRGKEIMIVMGGEDRDSHKDEVLCSSVVTNHAAKMQLAVFNEARKAFCESINGTVVPVGQGLTIRVLEIVSRHGARRTSVIGMIENNGKKNDLLDDNVRGGYLADTNECLKATKIFVTKTRGRCQEGGLAQGGMNYSNRFGANYILFPVDN